MSVSEATFAAPVRLDSAGFQSIVGGRALIGGMIVSMSAVSASLLLGFSCFALAGCAADVPPEPDVQEKGAATMVVAYCSSPVGAAKCASAVAAMYTGLQWGVDQLGQAFSRRRTIRIPEPSPEQRATLDAAGVSVVLISTVVATAARATGTRDCDSTVATGTTCTAPGKKCEKNSGMTCLCTGGHWGWQWICH